jgi:hypothetical protein
MLTSPKTERRFWFNVDKRGHPFDAENTRINHLGHRVCRRCLRDNERNKRAEAREVA